MKKLPYQILYLFVLALGLFLIASALFPPFTKVNQNESAERAMALIPVTALVEFLLLRIRNNKQNILQPINE